ncbi:hypothetical protein [Lutispora sp.]|uniref:hypothetical protein n=1 Tax=Lutispora sp. TaxID=2828727 RepID=UPI00356A54BB
MKKRYSVLVMISCIVLVTIITINLVANTTDNKISAGEIQENVELYYPTAYEVSDLIENSTYVVSGRFGKFVTSWNMARNPDNIKEEDPDYYIEGKVYEFIVDDCLKGILDDKKEILINLPYAHGDVIDEEYIEPDENESNILFLDYDENSGYYYPALEPYNFVLSDNDLFVKTNKHEVMKSFNAGKELNLNNLKIKLKDN